MTIVRLVLAVAVACSVILLSGCSTQQSALRSAASYSVRTTTNKFMFDSVAGLASVRTTVVLREGSYEPAGQDDVGVWYLGKPDSLLVAYTDSPKNRMDGKLAIAVFQGGVFVPHNLSQAERIFFIPKSESIFLADPGMALETITSGSRDVMKAYGFVLYDSRMSMGQVSLAIGLGSAIGGALVDYDGEGLKFLPASLPRDKSLRAWLAE